MFFHNFEVIDYQITDLKKNVLSASCEENILKIHLLRAALLALFHQLVEWRIYVSGNNAIIDSDVAWRLFTVKPLSETMLCYC